MARGRFPLPRRRTRAGAPDLGRPRYSAGRCRRDRGSTNTPLGPAPVCPRRRCGRSRSLRATAHLLRGIDSKLRPRVLSLLEVTEMCRLSPVGAAATSEGNGLQSLIPPEAGLDAAMEHGAMGARARAIARRGDRVAPDRQTGADLALWLPAASSSRRGGFSSFTLKRACAGAP